MNVMKNWELAVWIRENLACVIFALLVAITSVLGTPVLLFDKTPAEAIELLSAGPHKPFHRLKEHVGELAADVDRYELESFNKQRAVWDLVRVAIDDPADQSLIIKRAARSHDTVRESAAILEILTKLLQLNVYEDRHKLQLWRMAKAYYEILLDDQNKRRSAYRTLSEVYDELDVFPPDGDSGVRDAVESELLRQLTYLAFRLEDGSQEIWQKRANILGVKRSSTRGREYRRKYLWIDQSQLVLAIQDKDETKALAILGQMRNRLSDEDLFLWSKLIQHRNDISDEESRQIVDRLIAKIE